MFEKEAEEIANKKLCSERICYNRCNFNSPKHRRCGEWHRIYECAKDGAEFGYNKAFKAIAELEKEKEKCELLGIIRDKDKVIQELEKENAELKGEADNILDNWCRGDDPCPHLKKRDEQLTKSKKIIRNCLNLWDNVMTEETVKALIKEAEQFIKEVEK